MNAEMLLRVIHLSEKLKNETRHSYTSQGRHESVAEHSWRICLMAYLMHDEFPDADMDKVIRMCIIHDMGEIFIGDIPSFDKTAEDEANEEQRLLAWVATLPPPFNAEMRDLYAEMAERKSLEARIYKAIDNLEAIIQHNEADISTWLDNEYDLQLSYAHDRVAFSDYLKELRARIYDESVAKIEASKK